MKYTSLAFFFFISCNNISSYKEYYNANSDITQQIVKNYNYLTDSCNCNFDIKLRNDGKFDVINQDDNLEDMVVIDVDNIEDRFKREQCNNMIKSNRFKDLLGLINETKYLAVVRAKYGVFLNLGAPIDLSLMDAWHGGILITNQDSLMDGSLSDIDINCYDYIDSGVYIYDQPIVF